MGKSRKQHWIKKIKYDLRKNKAYWLLSTYIGYKNKPKNLNNSKKSYIIFWNKFF